MGDRLEIINLCFDRYVDEADDDKAIALVRGLIDIVEGRDSHERPAPPEPVDEPVRDVTSKLMGDPPPERSAQAAWERQQADASKT